MTSWVRIVVCPTVVVAAVTWAAADERNTEQEAAIVAITKMGGFVDVAAQRAGKPVIRVHLFEGKTAGIGLAPLAKLPEIEWIGLHASDMTEADLEYLKGLTHLRRLGLADTRLSDAGLKQLEDMNTLEILYLMENPITDAGLDHLRRLTKLKELGLGQTRITDAGLERLSTFTDLQVLGLQRLKITDAGLKHLKGLTKLRKLDLTGCHQVRDLKPLRGLALASVNLTDCGQLHDLAPLQGMPLSEIYLTPRNFTRDSLEVIRQSKTLKTIVIGYHGSDRLAAQDFWKRLDAGEVSVR